MSQRNTSRISVSTSRKELSLMALKSYTRRSTLPSERPQIEWFPTKLLNYYSLFPLLQELLHLYGFVIDNNPDDYLMVHYPMEAFQSVPIVDSKVQLLEIQKAEMRCLLPRSLLDHGSFSGSPLHEEDRNKKSNGLFCNVFFVHP
ncbi:uncharacterized protein LOC131225691 [Magnolia sinica]|uniref:uncharacterized protein LOC131225691 n=1 Tax=Magnolia sinica TaxID=86752 RepID=UPI00265A798C|nr:uncharacterized protein LOC131225691 [Magnolia sinica]